MLHAKAASRSSGGNSALENSAPRRPASVSAAASWRGGLASLRGRHPMRVRCPDRVPLSCDGRPLAGSTGRGVPRSRPPEDRPRRELPAPPSVDPGGGAPAPRTARRVAEGGDCPPDQTRWRLAGRRARRLPGAPTRTPVRPGSCLDGPVARSPGWRAARQSAPREGRVGRCPRGGSTLRGCPRPPGSRRRRRKGPRNTESAAKSRCP